MRIVINALGLRDGGGATLISQQLSALAKVSPSLQLHTLVSPWSELGDLPGTVETVRVPNVPTRFAYEQVCLPFRHADILYCIGNFAPMGARAPIVLMIQNAHYYRAGLAFDAKLSSRNLLKVKAAHMALRHANRIVAVSNSLAEDAVATVPGLEHKIVVLHSGAPVWPQMSTPVDSVPPRYFLTVSGVAPHKRLGDTIRGWARAVSTIPDPVPLVVVGQVGHDEIARHRLFAGEFDGLLFHTGPVTDRSKLKWLYEHATVTIQMSALESFSFTPVEAGSLGSPLVVSDIPAHRETVGGDATFVPVGDVEGLSRVLQQNLDRWSPGSQRWSWPVSWDDNAESLLAVFRSVSPAVAVGS